MFSKVLVANRGEIALRIMRTCRRLGVKTVAVYSDADASAPHVRQADEAVHIGAAPVRESYLRMDAVIEASRRTGADAVHPGYGLLSENPRFARAVQSAGVTFIGPTPECLELFGDKLRARQTAVAAGLAVLPAAALCAPDPEMLAQVSATIGFPMMVKSVAGGGGIGMQIVAGIDALARAARTCSDRSRAAFDDPRIYVEKVVEHPRHIEVQALVDRHGDAVVLGDRECSVQRRYQKVIEESPSPAARLDEGGGAGRQALWSHAKSLLQSSGYVGAGTVEFLTDGAGQTWFLEVNARLQVEHPVTEMVTGVDLVEQQLRIACGEPIGRDLPGPSGHAVEARIYAEDPSQSFLPQPGVIARLEWPRPCQELRIDAGIEAGSVVTPYYDPMLAKVAAWGVDRPAAVRRLYEALGEVELDLQGKKGRCATNLEFLREVLASDRFGAGTYDTGLVQELRPR